MNKRHYEHTLPNIRGSLSNTYVFSICVLASFVRLGAKDRNDMTVNIFTGGHCKIIPE